MFDTFKKGLMTGLGVGLMTKGKIEEFARKVALEAKLSEMEGRKFVDDMIAESKKTQEKLEERIQGAVADALTKVNVATKDDIAALEARISKLEDRDA